MNNYYPFSWVRGRGADSLEVIQGEKRHWIYHVRIGDSEPHMVVETNHRHEIISISYPNNMYGLWVSLMRAWHKGWRIDWHNVKNNATP